MINFLYCFDKNYVNQAQTSINSLLNNVSEKIAINIICNDKQSALSVEHKFKNHYMVGALNTYNFDSKNYNFPKLSGAHVSSATYFRILIDQFLPKEIQNVVYLDSDIICLNDPIQSLKETCKDLKKQNIALAAYTEGTRHKAPILFNKLKLKNDKYFNAGVLVINYNYWFKNSISKSLLDIMKKRHTDLIFWDQDLLNIYLDSNYLELSKNLNYNYVEKDSLKNKDIIFLHYAGKDKPWDVQNVMKQFSRIYQKKYSKLNYNKYHIVFKRDKKTLKAFLKVLIKLEFLKLENPLSYLHLSIKAFFNND